MTAIKLLIKATHELLLKSFPNLKKKNDYDIKFKRWKRSRIPKFLNYV